MRKVSEVVKKHKKHVWSLVGIVLLLAVFPFTLDGYADTNAMEDYQVIPDEAIRLRILADSDNKKDQDLKRKVRDAVNAEITVWVEELTSIETARELIESRLGDIEEIVAKVLKEEGMDQTYQVDFGQVEFPAKLYGTYLYPAGTYEAILITLGEGKGANWWCVLFPPLCFLDFSNGTSVAQEVEETEQSEEVAVEVENTEEDINNLSTTSDKKEVKVKFFLTEWLDFL